MDFESPTGLSTASLEGRIDAVVVGASAGGVEALGTLLPALPREFRPTVLVVIHQPRERRSLLADIFSARCALPVQEAQDKEPAQPGTIYFAPPDYHLLVDDGPSLALSADEPVLFSRPSIDVLFESAADTYGHRLAGLILTGANSDGARGLAAVRQAGGVALVQRPDTALVATMPTAALARGPADFVLSLEQMARLLRMMGGGHEG